MNLLIDGNNLAWAGFHALRKAMEAETEEQKTRAALLEKIQKVGAPNAEKVLITDLVLQ